MGWAEAVVVVMEAVVGGCSQHWAAAFPCWMLVEGEEEEEAR